MINDVFESENMEIKKSFARWLPSMSVSASTHDQSVATLAKTQQHRANLAILILKTQHQSHWRGACK